MGDSPRIAGGRIPGDPGGVAFSLTAPEPSSIPLLIAAPHGGRAYPRGLLDHMRDADTAMLRLEDRYVDLLAEAIAAETGAALLIAHAPRAMIDLNRAADDVDWGMFGHAPGDGTSHTPGAIHAPGAYSSARRARSGLGLIPRRLPGIGELWKRRLPRADLIARIAGIHEPYHACLAQTLRGLRDRWGAALLLDLHSMPPLTSRGIGGAAVAGAEFVVGDRFGVSCHGGLIAASFDYLAGCGRRAAHNRPYAGGYVLDRHAAPARGLHAIQIEIDRGAYLDTQLAERGPGFDGMVALLVGLVRRLAGEVAALAALTPQTGSIADWPEAAE